jgi:hypothetical protein
MNREPSELVNFLELVSYPTRIIQPDPYLQTIHPQATKSVIRALLWSIFFQRTLDNCEPDTFEILNTYIVRLVPLKHVGNG